MRTALILATLALLGCSDPPPLANAEQIQNTANALRADVNGVVDELKPFAPLIEAYCALHGEDGKRCATMRTGWNAADRAIDTAHEFIDAYESVGVGASKVEDAIKAVHAAARDVKAAVLEVVSNAHVDQEPDRSGSGSGEGADRPQAEPTSAEGAGQASGQDAAAAPVP